MSFQTTEILNDRQYVSLSALESSVFTTTVDSSTSLTGSRLKVSNLLNQDIILPVQIKNLSEHIYFGSAYVQTKVALNKIIEGYPIGLSGSSTGNLYLEDIQSANDFIANLDEYEFWVLRQLCGEQLTTSTMSFTATATAIPVSLSATITPLSTTYVLPVINRDSNNYVMPPQGVHTKVRLDNYYDDLLAQETDSAIENLDSISPFEQILTTAIAFDSGVQFALKGWSGTGSDKFVFTTYDGLLETQIIPEVFTLGVNRKSKLENLVSPALFQDDYTNVMSRFLQSMAKMMDEVKLYIDGLKSLFKNYWGNWERLPKGYIQQLVAHQYGIELFSSENPAIVDELTIRGQYKSQKEITFEFWNRILCSLVYILKTKGTIESIKAAARSYGFPPNLIDIYELGSYKSFLTGFYGAPLNHAVGKFRRTVEPGHKAFQSASAVLTGVSTSALFVHSKVRFMDDLANATLSGASGVLYSFGTQLNLSYAYKQDTQNVSTSGYPYIQFTLSAGTNALTTNYAFTDTVQRQSPDGYWNIVSGRDKDVLYVGLGYLQSNYEYQPPVLITTTGSALSLSSTLLTPTAVTVGSNVNVPQVNLSNFYVQKIGYDAAQFKRLVLDSNLLATTSGYAANVLAWKFNENITLDVSGKNYLLDSASSVTGKATFVGTSGNPYAYEYDMPAFYNDGIAGFKQQKVYNVQADVRDDKNLRVGISLASPINSYIHSVIGSRFGELYANPADVYSSSGSSHSTYSYGLAEQKTIDMFNIVGISRSGVQISEFLKFINRINGHLGSFFQFIEQIVPASKRILEKGLIIENPINQRIILSKSSVDVADGMDMRVTALAPTVLTVDNRNVFTGRIAIEDNVQLPQNNYFGVYKGTITERLSGNGSISTVDIKNNRNNNSVGLVVNTDTSYGWVGTMYTDTVSMGLDESAENVESIEATIDATPKTFSGYRPTTQLEYLPHRSINDRTITPLKQPIELDKKDNKLQYQLPIASVSSNSYFLHAVLDKEHVLVSTSTTADASQRKVTGRIFIVDNVGRKVSTQYDAIRINFNEAQYNNLNAVNFIADGQYVPYNQRVTDFAIASATGITFELNTVGAPTDGTAANQQIQLFIENLLNPQEDGLFIKLLVGQSMEDFSSDTGFSITQVK